MNKRAVIGAICAISALFAFNGSASTFADNGVGFSIDVSEATLQLTAPETATIVLNPISSAAVFNSTSFNVNVATNNMTGYTLTMSVATTDLTHNTLANTVIPTLSAASTEANFPANAWGYKVVGDEYQPILTTNAPASWAVEEPTNGTNHNIVFGAKVDGSKPSGSYETTLNFQAVANPNAHKDTVTFNKNNENATGSMPDQVIYQDGASKINPNAFQLSGMQFMGWSTTASGTGAGVLYFGDNTIYISPNPGQNNNVTLYAQWAPAGTPTSTTPSGVSGTTFARAYEVAYTAAHKGMYEKDESEGGDNKYHLINSWAPDNEQYHGYDVRFAMQDMTSEICSSVTVLHDDYQALDIRDDKLYHITKMADGKCWMTQNLDLNLTHGVALTDQDTDLTNKSSWDPTNSTVSFSGTTLSTWGNDNQAPWSADSDSVFAVPNGSGSFLYTLDQCKSTLNVSTEYCMHYHTGNYYNYAAAIAENAASSAFNNWQYVQAPNSICPKGWRLPESLKGETKTEAVASDYNKLLYHEGIISEWASTGQSIGLTQTKYNTLHSEPIFLVEAGYIYGGRLTNVGYYRVAGTATSVESYYLYFGQSSITTDENYTYRYLAEPVRCLAR